MYQNKRTRLGFIGIGLMGEPMVMRLMAADYQVTVWNRNRDKLANVAAAGAIPAASASDVAHNSDIILLCLTNTEAVEAVTVSDPDFVSALDSSKLIIDLSSMSPVRAKEIAVSLFESSATGWIDSPVSGGVPGAEQGTLVTMVGGKASDVERARPILSVLAQRITHMGDHGAGQATKLANQIIVGCNITAISEAIRLAESLQVDTTLMTDALAGGFADSLPLQIFGKAMAAKQHEPVSIKLELMLKDLQGALTLDPQNQLHMEMARTAATRLTQAVEAFDGSTSITRVLDAPPVVSQG